MCLKRVPNEGAGGEVAVPFPLKKIKAIVIPAARPVYCCYIYGGSLDRRRNYALFLGSRIVMSPGMGTCLI